MDQSNERIIEETEQPAREKIYRDKKQKRLEEKKEYIPIIDPKQTVEILAKPKPPIEEIEKIEKPEEEDKKESGKNGRAKNRKKKETALSGNSILIITEKPQAAAK